MKKKKSNRTRIGFEIILISTEIKLLKKIARMKYPVKVKRGRTPEWKNSPKLNLASLLWSLTLCINFK
jgi:hypothetical protein